MRFNAMQMISNIFKEIPKYYSGHLHLQSDDFKKVSSKLQLLVRTTEKR